MDNARDLIIAAVALVLGYWAFAGGRTLEVRAVDTPTSVASGRLGGDL